MAPFKPISAILLFIIIGKNIATCAGNPNPVKNFINPKEWSFVENKGQLAPSLKGDGFTPTLKGVDGLGPLQGDKGLSEVKYYSHSGGAQIYCRPGKISFVFTKEESENKENISEATGNPISDVGVQNFEPLHRKLPGNSKFNTHNSKFTINRLDLLLLNSNPNAQITAADQQAYYENFYLGHTPEEGITNVHTYKTIIYKNIYPHIDMLLHCKEGGMKYEFIVNPGGKVNDIQMQWAGIEKIQKLKDSKIEYSFPLGKMTESAPYSYNDQGKVESQFILKNNRAGFKVGKYDHERRMIIDPSLVWGTYFGGDEQEMGYGITTDASGNVEITGVTNSNNKIATNGAFQTSNAGIWDAFLSKFSSNGNLLWSTFYGGTDNDYGQSVCTDGAGNVYMAGFTKSGDIATPGGNPFSGTNYDDAFLAKFSSSGKMVWATCFGGSEEEQASGVCTDTLGNIYLTGFTISSGLATAGAAKTINDGYDAFLVKYASSGKIIWSTYYGGNLNDDAESIATDASGSIYIAGNTNSSFGLATSGAYQTSFSPNGSYAFLAKFLGSGQLIWSTYYGGGHDGGAEGVCTDRFGNVFITGGSLSTTGIATAGAYQSLFAGKGIDEQYGDAFLAKFTPSGLLLWGTYYGGTDDDIGTGVSTDNLGNVYICGATESNNGIATKGSYETSLAKGDDGAFLAKFNGSGEILWSTYYGASDFAQGVSADKSGNVYITGGTFSAVNISTPDGYETDYAGNMDAFVAKFNSQLPDIGISGFASPVDSLCPGQNDSVTVKLKNFGQVRFISAIIHWTINGKLQDSVTWTGLLLHDSFRLVKIGNLQFLHPNDTIVAWTTLANSSDTIHNNDTAKIIVKFFNVHFSAGGNTNLSICSGTHIRIGNNPAPGNIYAWTSNPKGFTSTVSNPIVNPDSATTYFLTESSPKTGCINKDTSHITVKPVKAPVANAGKSKSICLGDSALIGSNGVAGLAYIWSSIPPGFVSTKPKLYVKPIITTAFTVQVTNPTGCTDINSDTITVFNPLAITGPPQSVCSGALIKLGTFPISGHQYFWTSKPSGFTTSISNPSDTINHTTTYYLTESIPGTGCQKTDSVLIKVIPRPIVKIQIDSIDVFTRKFTALNPNYPGFMYKWNFGDSDTSSGYSVKHEYKNTGKYLTTLTVANPGYCTEKDSVPVNIQSPFILTIFPNPYSTQTDIQYILPNAVHIKIEIIDMLGRDIITLIDKTLEPGEYNTIFNGSAYKTRPGMYLVVFMMDEKVITRKMIQLDSIFY